MARRALRRPPIGIDISIIGVPGLEKKLNRLKLATSKTIVSKAARVAAKNSLKSSMDANLAAVASGPFNTGNLKRLKTNIRNISRKNKRSVGIWIYSPSREKLKIKPDASYYPLLLERGHHGVAPQNMFKKARDQKAKTTINRWGERIGVEIDRMVRKMGKRAFR